MIEPSGGTQKIAIPDQELARQAVAALRGYAYQVWASALAWARLGPDQTLLLEVADDYSVVSAEALSLTQVKDTAASGSATLRTKGVVDAINRYWRFKAANPHHSTSLSYLTTAKVGKEQGAKFPDDLAGLQAWRAAAIDGSETGPLRAFLLDLPLDEDLKSWLITADDDSFRATLLRPIHWRCAEPPLSEVETLLDEALVVLCASASASGIVVRDLRDGLLVEVLRCAVKPDSADRSLRQVDLQERIQRLAASALPSLTPTRGGGLQALDNLNEMWSGGLSAARPAAVGRLAKASSRGPAWLHGPSGIGKSALARSLTAGGNRPWYSLDLRDQPPLEITRRLRAARQDLLSIEAFGGVILEDLNYPVAGATKRELTLLLWQATLQDARVVITAYKPPTPGLMGELGLEAGGLMEAPRFDETETAALITLAGGDPGVWAKPVHVFSGSGFPQLVAARVAGLKLRGWPKDEVLGFLDAHAHPDDVGEEREATRSRLIAELPPPAASLLYRVSLISGAFDRDLAMALASAAPAIVEPGAALDMLVGPWLEPVGKGRLRVSPLVSDAGTKVLAPTEQRGMHEIIVSALTSRSTLQADQLPQLLVSSLVTSSHRGLWLIVQAALLKPLPNEVLSHVLFGLKYLRTDRPLIDDHPGLNQMLRMSQLKVATVDGPVSLIEATYNRLSAEETGSPTDEPLQGAASFVLATSDVLIPAKTWFPVVHSLRPDIIARTGNLMGVPFSMPVEDMGVFLFTYRSYRLIGLDDLRDLFELLQEIPVDRREAYFEGFAAPNRKERGTRRSLVESAWLAEVGRDGFDADVAVAKLEALEQRVLVWPDEALAVECACARVVLLAEYASKGEAALKEVDVALERWPTSARLRRERGKILFGLRRFELIEAEADALLANVADGDPVDRAYTTRDVAVAAAEMGDLPTAISLMMRAEAAAAEMSGLSPMRLKLAADIVILTWRAGEREAALRAALAVLERAADEPADDSIVRAMVVMAEVLHEDVAQPGWDTDTAVFGIASRIVDAPDDLPKPPLLTVYYRLAQTEALLRLDVGIDAALERRAQEGRLVVYEQVRQTRAGWNAFQSADPKVVAEQFIPFAQVGAWMRRNADTEADPSASLLKILPELPWAGPFDPTDELARQFAVGGFLVSLAFATAREERNWIGRLLAVSTENAEVSKLMATFPTTPIDLDQNDQASTILWSLARISDETPHPNELFMATAHVLRWLGETFLSGEIAAAIGPMIAARWRSVATDQRFNLRSPSTYAPAILEAANEVIDRPALARLILAAHPAVSVNVSPQVLQAWGQISAPKGLR